MANFSQEMNSKFRALDEKASITSYALRYVAGLPNVKEILSGMSSMEQVKDNIETFSPFIPLNEKECMVIEQTREILQARVQSGCTGCGYCMPSPYIINRTKDGMCPFEASVLVETDCQRAYLTIQKN